MMLQRETEIKGLGKILGPLSVTVENTFRQRSSVKRTPKRYDWYQATIRFYCEEPQPDLAPVEYDAQALG